MADNVADHTRGAEARLREELELLRVDRDRLAALVAGDARTAADGIINADRRAPADALMPAHPHSASGFKLRPPNIPRFAGDREKALDWMLAIDRRLAASGDVHSLAGLEYATGHFDDFAAVWWRYLSSTHPEITGWSSLRPHFDQHFKLVGEEELYEKRLLEVKQRDTVDEYVTEFLKCAVRLPHLSDEFKRRRFRQGLCSRLRNDFAVRKFVSLDEMVRETLNLLTMLDASLLVADAESALPVVAAMPAKRAPFAPPGLTPPGTVTCYLCGQKGHKKPQCPDKHRKKGRSGGNDRTPGNPRPRGDVPMGRYNGGGRIHNIEAVDNAEDEEVSDDELRQGNDLA